jgi:hypothetical protein
MTNCLNKRSDSIEKLKSDLWQQATTYDERKWRRGLKGIIVEDKIQPAPKNLRKIIKHKNRPQPESLSPWQVGKRSLWTETLEGHKQTFALRLYESLDKHHNGEPLMQCVEKVKAGIKDELLSARKGKYGANGIFQPLTALQVNTLIENILSPGIFSNKIASFISRIKALDATKNQHPRNNQREKKQSNTSQSGLITQAQKYWSNWWNPGANENTCKKVRFKSLDNKM